MCKLRNAYIEYEKNTPLGFIVSERTWDLHNKWPAVCYSWNRISWQENYVISTTYSYIAHFPFTTQNPQSTLLRNCPWFT